MENMDTAPEPPFRSPVLPMRQLSRLPAAKREQLVGATVEETLSILEEAGYVEYPSIDAAVRHLTDSDFIARREDPKALLKAVQGTPLAIDFPEGSRYSNAVEWDSSTSSKHLDNAFAEGYGVANAVVTVAGMRRNGLDIRRLDDASQVFNDLTRTHVVSIRGSVAPSDIVFIIVRAPIQAFPHERLTDSEMDRLDEYRERESKKPEYVSRCFVHPAAIHSMH